MGYQSGPGLQEENRKEFRALFEALDVSGSHSGAVDSSDQMSVITLPVTYVGVPNGSSPSTPPDNIRVMVIVWRLRGNIIRTALCWIV